MAGWDYSSLSTVKRQWLTDKKVRVLIQFGSRKIPELADVPLARDNTITKVDRDVLDLATMGQEIGRPYIAPPGLPKARLDALRASFQTLLKDKEFLKVAKRAHVEINPSTAEECLALLNQLYKSPKDVVAKVRAILKPKGKAKK
jgi:tripartite-type tricarboxylate transporter receptor subunit TctC